MPKRNATNPQKASKAPVANGSTLSKAPQILPSPSDSLGRFEFGDAAVYIAEVENESLEGFMEQVLEAATTKQFRVFKPGSKLPHIVDKGLDHFELIDLQEFNQWLSLRFPDFKARLPEIRNIECKKPDWNHWLLRHQKGNATKAEAICLSLEIDPLVLGDLSDQGSSHFCAPDKTEFSKRMHRLNSIFATEEVVKFSDGRLTLLSFARWAGKAGIRLPLEMYHWMKESYEAYEEAYRSQKIQEAVERCKEIEAAAIVCEVEIPFSCQVMPISQLLQLIEEAPYPVSPTAARKQLAAALSRKAVWAIADHTYYADLIHPLDPETLKKLEPYPKGFVRGVFDDSFENDVQADIPSDECLLVIDECVEFARRFAGIRLIQAGHQASSAVRSSDFSVPVSNDAPDKESKPIRAKRRYERYIGLGGHEKKIKNGSGYAFPNITKLINAEKAEGRKASSKPSITEDLKYHLGNLGQVAIASQWPRALGKK